MTPERWARVAEIYDAVIDAPVDRRAVVLLEACAGDEDLRQEVESLLAQEQRDSPVDMPVWDTVAGVLKTTNLRLEAGHRLGPYIVEGVVGTGGMGEVYRARDTNLGRTVALKVLPQSWASDPDRLARFAREAQMLAALNHPNIATIHGVEQASDPPVRALVMELVDGVTLADRISRGPIPVEETVSIGRQIADALEAAHEQGIVHRDLKPANIKLRPDDTVKVLDFGLAKPIEPISADVSLSPTITTPAVTGTGVILGTAAYMSPEQAKGRAADRRTDIWAFGCVIYEMLTGSRAFPGEDVSDTLAAVLRAEPDWTRLPTATPARLRRLLVRCLAKNSRDRLQHLGDARLELADVTSDAMTTSSGRSLQPGLAWLGPGSVAVIALAIAVFLVTNRSGPAPQPELRVEVSTPATTDPFSFAIDPDGRHLTFVASGANGPSQLWVRSLDASSARPLDGTERARYPFWSPDSRSIGFFADGKLKRLTVASGAIQVVTDAVAGYGGTWNRDDVILFAPSGGQGIRRASAAGGESRLITQHGGGPGHRFPQFLPDGQHFLFYASDTHEVYVAGLSSEPRRLLDADAPAAYSATGHVLYVSQGKLFAQPFDAVRLELSGAPLLLVEQITALSDNGVAAVSTSSAGPIAYRTGPVTLPSRQLAWVDRSGRVLTTIGAPDAAPLSVDPALSPDDRRIALWRTENSNPDVWLLDALDGRRVRMTSESAADMFPMWSNDGGRIAFGSNRTGKTMEIVVRSASGVGDEHVLLSNGDYNFPLDWSRDGRFILYGKGAPAQGQDLYALSVAGEPKSISIAVGPSDDRLGQFSPDGKWVAYQSNESGRFEIYVRPFPGPGTKVPISSEGGTQVRWRPDGKELLFVSPDDRLMSVRIAVTADGAMTAGIPMPLFTTHLSSNAQPNLRAQYAIARDGQRILLNTLREEATETPIKLLMNWRAGK